MITGEQYVGLTQRTIEIRWKQHCYNYLHGHEGQLYDCMRKYDKEFFYIDQIDVAYNIKDLNVLEQLWILKLDTFKNGLNMTTGGRSYLLSEDTKRKIGDKNRGFKHSDETKQILSQKHTGKILSESHIKNISIGLMGNKYCVGYKHSDETKLKRSKSMRYSDKCKNKYKGTHFLNKQQRWRSSIRIGDGGKILKNLGTFLTQEEAAQAYNDAVDKYWNGEGYKNVIE